MPGTGLETHLKSVDLVCHEPMADPPVDMETGTTQGAVVGAWKGTSLEIINGIRDRLVMSCAWVTSSDGAGGIAAENTAKSLTGARSVAKASVDPACVEMPSIVRVSAFNFQDRAAMSVMSTYLHTTAETHSMRRKRLRLGRVQWEDTGICDRLRPFLELWQQTPCVIIKTPPSRAPHQNATPPVDKTARPEVCTHCRYSDKDNGMRHSIVTVLAKVREIWANSDIGYIGRPGAQELSLILVHRLALGPPNRFRTAIKNVHKSDNDAQRIALVCSVLAIKFYSGAENTDNILRILSVPNTIGHNFERLEIPCFEALNWNVVQQPCIWSLLLSAGLIQPFAEHEASMKGFDVAIQLLYRSNTSETAFGIAESDPPLAALAVYQFTVGAVHMQSANLFAPTGPELVVRAYARILEAGPLAAMYIDACASTRLGFFDDPDSDFPTERHVTAMHNLLGFMAGWGGSGDAG